MKINFIFCLLILFTGQQSFAWDQTGHRIVTQIAQNHLNAKAKEKIKKLLGTESLPQVSNWADFIRSDAKWKKADPWHYCSFPDDKTLDTMERNPNGDVLWAIDHFTQILKTPKKFPEEDQIQALKFLVHFVGDIHQPLHVGRPQDEGGNKISVKWFGQESNLHKVWDEGLLGKQGLSYTEYASFIDHATKAQIKEWQKSTPKDWAQESFQARSAIYQEVEDSTKRDLSYHYVFEHTATVEQRLLRAGIRLAGWLNNF
ncbi:MAG: S1/P1 nuclease [Pseudomonadota bacterium]